MKGTVITIALALVLGGLAQSVRAENYPADNTGKNARDRDGTTLTTGDQSENQNDLKITQEIRKAIVSDKNMSTNAHNVKVITTGGVVTLRGPVNSAEEKAKINATAQRVAGVSRVDNQLEVVKKQ